MSERLKIGLDFHGVINKRPQFFSAFTILARKKGHEIHIITGGPSQVVKKMLDEWQVSYDYLFAILDYYGNIAGATYFENGELKVPAQLWDTAKAEYCMTHGINMHIDDSSQYVKWFSTPYCHYDENSKTCKMPNALSVDFSQMPEKALQEIEQAVTSYQYF